MRATTGRSSSEESPVRLACVRYNFRNGQEEERAVCPLPGFFARWQFMHLGGHVHVRDPLWGAPAHLIWWSLARWLPAHNGHIVVPFFILQYPTEWSNVWHQSHPRMVGKGTYFSTYVRPPNTEGGLLNIVWSLVPSVSMKETVMDEWRFSSGIWFRNH